MDGGVPRGKRPRLAPRAGKRPSFANTLAGSTRDLRCAGQGPSVPQKWVGVKEKRTVVLNSVSGVKRSVTGAERSCRKVSAGAERVRVSRECCLAGARVSGCERGRRAGSVRARCTGELRELAQRGLAWARAAWAFCEGKRASFAPNGVGGRFDQGSSGAPLTSAERQRTRVDISMVQWTSVKRLGRGRGLD